MINLCTKCQDGDRSLPHVFPEGSQPPLVAICTPIYDHPEEEFRQSLNRLWKPSTLSEQFPGGGCHQFSTMGVLLDKARNQLTEQALLAVPKVTHVLMIDADMQFPPNALLQLIEHDEPIVGGLCHNRRPPYNPIVVRLLPDGSARYVYDLPARGLVECDFTGAAFLLVAREVFERLGDNGWWSPVDEMTEDFSFMHRARAAGYRIFVDAGLDVGHKADVMITKSTAARLRDFRWAAYEEDPVSLADGKPVASIIIPTYNQQPHLLRAAVMSAALQTVPIEVIVVDDGSDPPVPFDGWPENVKVVGDYFRDGIVRNRGVASALNTGIAAMTTDWFCWLSSDDMMSPRKVETQLRAMKAAGCKASFHRYQILECDAKGTPVEDFPRIVNMPEWKTIAEQMEILGQVCAINGSTVMIHRDALLDAMPKMPAWELGERDSLDGGVGPFDTRLRFGQDWELWCRIGRELFWLPITEILGTRRELAKGGNLTSDIAADREKQARRAP